MSTSTPISTPVTPAKSHLTYRPEIDGLRGLAVLMVIIFHAGGTWLGGGFLGVDVFFVISGYLIAAIAIREISEGQFQTGRFLERRLRRILPALFVLCIICLVPAWLLLPPTDFKDFVESILGNVIAVNNYLFLSEAGYFDRASEMKPLLHTWSLSVEIQFYLTVALLLKYGPCFALKRTNIVIALIGLFSAITYIYVASHYYEVSFYIFPTRIWEFMAGVGVALILVQSKIKGTWVPLVSLCVLILTIFGFDWFIHNPHIARALVVIPTALLLATAANGGFANKLLSSKGLVWVGVISYSLYLLHNPILTFARFENIQYHPVFLTTAAIALIVLSYLSWRFVENPCRNRKLVSTKLFVIACLVFFVASIVLYAATDKSKGFIKQRLNSNQTIMMASAVRQSQGPSCRTGGENYRKPSDACLMFGKQPSWAILGDSHTGASAYAIAEAISNQTGEASQGLSMRGCPPPNIDKQNNACAKWTGEAINWLIQDKNIHSVVLVYRLNVYFWGPAVNAYPLKGRGESERVRLQTWDNYQKIVMRLKDAGKQVLIVTPTPEPYKRVTDLIFSQGTQQRDIAGSSLEDWERRNAFTMDNMRALPKDIYIYNPNDLFCDDQSCYAVKELEANYYDHNHLSEQAANKLATGLIDDYFKD